MKIINKNSIIATKWRIIEFRRRVAIKMKVLKYRYLENVSFVTCLLRQIGENDEL